MRRQIAVSDHSSVATQPNHNPVRNPRSESPPDILAKLERETAELTHFLKSCTPDMSQYLHHFIGFGCKNKKFLSVANTWDDKEVKGFLKGVSDRGEVPMTPMEMLVLKNHLRRYFT
ncbi:uncharacterized protein LACBIDRAFT_314227 [Laccaria bicolor S238N-H82]|uniref:Predicted protein n=1 Tax=Laccaria bicolor (strain S238N-H82 / ATCC MYA-4686) TaxID=486041 RepID=B0D1V5_LACBS|nr:uncharacterized protein LACBIDRAFT_314227 [Laccaria bicolor S238N-H82]EDR12056.1 predicted protein [Laccaria bicolor S238N-H82]|eukprot:XP_001877953.1 predicted protein [Laccaria bicolor S238N-H82]